MAIAIDTATDGGLVNPATSLTYSHTCSGDNRVLIVHAVGEQSADVLTGATYKGVSMTLLAKGQSPSDRWSYLWYLFAPDTGANDVVISASASTAIFSVCASYTGVDQGGIDNSATVQDTTGAATASLTPTVDGCWVIEGARTAGASSAGTDTIERVERGSNGEGIYESSLNPIDPAASTTLEITRDGGGDENARIVILSLAPAAEAAADQNAVFASINF